MYRSWFPISTYSSVSIDLFYLLIFQHPGLAAQLQQDRGEEGEGHQHGHGHEEGKQEEKKQEEEKDQDGLDATRATPIQRFMLSLKEALWYVDLAIFVGSMVYTIYISVVSGNTTVANTTENKEVKHWFGHQGLLFQTLASILRLLQNSGCWSHPFKHFGFMILRAVAAVCAPLLLASVILLCVACPVMFFMHGLMMTLHFAHFNTLALFIYEYWVAKGVGFLVTFVLNMIALFYVTENVPPPFYG